MRIQELTGRHKGETIYILGTGPTARLLPLDFFANRTTIGLNQWWRYGPATYSISVHPELVQDYEHTAIRPKTRWIVKKKAPLQNLELDDPRYYVFHTAEDWSLFENPRADTLFIGRGVQQTAMDLARRLGARTIILAGVDMGQLGDDHHGHHQHVRFHGLPASDVYLEYRKWTAKARRLLRQHAGIEVLQLTPLLGATAGEEDYQRLLQERNLPALPRPPDTSKYRRDKADI